MDSVKKHVSDLSPQEFQKTFPITIKDVLPVYADWDELYFRDYLLDNPDVAKEYSCLKEKILDDISNGRLERMPNGQPNGYSNAKLSFVKDVSQKARDAYQGRYKLK